MFYFRVVALFLLFCITLGSFAPYYDLVNAGQHFADFINKYEKKYESPEEFSRHFDIFKKNLNKINEWNTQFKHENGRYVINQFSDQDGPRSCVDLPKMSNTSRAHKVKKEYIHNTPDKVDYREQNLVTGIKNQKDCGACYIFSAVGNIEGVHSKQSGQLITLSEQQALDCTYNDGCQGGWPYSVITALVEQGCLAEEDYNPYQDKKETCTADLRKVKVRVSDPYMYETPDVETMKGALIQNGAPLSVVFYASEQFHSYVGNDVLNPTDCVDHQSETNHAIVLVGYNADPSSGKRPHWIIKNSWGKEHGDKGYFYLDFENHCNFGTDGPGFSTTTALP